MIISMLILYPLLILANDLSKHILCPLIFLVCIGYLVQTNSLMGTLNWTGLLETGLIRGLGEISLGVCCFHIAEKFKKYQLNAIGKVIVNVIIISCLVITLLFAHNDLHSVKDFAVLIVIAIMVTLIFSNQGYHIKPGNRICIFLGAISLPFFLYHGAFSALMTTFMNVNSALTAMIGSLIFSTIVYLCVKYLRKYVKRGFINLVLKKTN